MKNTKILITLVAGMCLAGLSSCEDLLNRAPISSVTPEVFLYNEADLAAYAIANYNFSSPAPWGNSVYAADGNTDNQATGNTPSNIFRPGEIKVGAGLQNWDFNQIRNCNYFMDVVIPRYEAGSLKGNAVNIKHYIGEMYFFRAWEYFAHVRQVGDYPIIKTVLTEDFESLVKANERAPRNEVMRFVLSDLDKAIELLSNTPPAGKNRISKNTALLIKSRAALYEGSFLKYFAGTAYVPQGPGWPGKTKEYSKNYAYSTGSVEAESKWFLEQAIDAADKVASNVTLTANNFKADEVSKTAISNPYFVMFSDIGGQEKYAEVLLWRAYNGEQKILHSNSIYLQSGSWNTGLTRGYVDSYLMANGLPIYAPGSGYAGDVDYASYRKDRDQRLQLFTKAKGDYSVWPEHSGTGKYPAPPLFSSMGESVNNTGYSSRKMMDYKDWGVTGAPCSNGFVIFRAAEAYLNYIEAYYLLNNSLGGNCATYWKAIRNRAGVDEDYNKTIAATDIAIEAKGDWGAYSAGRLIDATLYNIRRERRDEFMSEGMRWDDLIRWRAMDQMITEGYQVEGFNLWGGDNSKDPAYKGKLKYIGDSAGSTGGYTVSSPTLSKYLRPFQVIKANNFFYDGLRWHSAHYLNPIGANSYLRTAADKATVETSPIYPNPGWGTQASTSPKAVEGF
ncbi:MAG: RagB/SusD family nutrient uptake outer membrane protein [Mucinivorans sp.]